MANQPTTKSIYDFIYLDTNKIHSYYSQLTDGLPNQKTLTDKDIRGRVSKGMAGPRDILHGEHSTHSSSEEAYEELMDMAHTLPRYLINLLDDYGMIAKKLAPNHLGKLVLVNGTLHLNDVNHFSDLAVPLITLLKKGVFKDKYQELLGDFSEEQVFELAKIFKSYPLRLQANLMVTQTMTIHYAWMSLQEDSFTQSYVDFSLKHEHVSNEEFYILGILDAIPDSFINKDNKTRQTALTGKVKSSNALGGLPLRLNHALKALVGRPNDFYGLTPICIFRKIDIPDM